MNMDRMLDAFSNLETKDMVAVVALIVSVIALLVGALQRRRERAEAVIQGLGGDRKAVTYAEMTIRLSGLLSRREHRRSLIASLLLAWNFETSDRARAAVLAALVAARTDHPNDYENVVQIIGRGTRVRDDYGKLFFNISDKGVWERF